MSGKSNAVAIVNDLLDCCRDAEKGFREAARDVRDKKLQDLFLVHARQMGDFSGVLEKQVVHLGGAPHKKGSVVGLMHRTWIGARSLLNFRNPTPVLVECERGEAAAISHYEHALDSPLPQEVKDMIEKQFVEILLARNHIRDVETGDTREAKKSYNPLFH
jgi:uncharacterized protein (TIGR02284 family)